ncbi:cyclic di-GMP phosphodiesterase response regulator RpfG [Clostridium acetireducens DSM 10703]|uniref:Cyclic di-GMP phosphodiesterase response regulator RpfG n=1 Tax=Clostridium acetireducens DSM 10703 TaxID=1121290 RepID=A0A1E8F0E0_9CLOT|nr:diguanylate cyclase [Clostridium acetireducens]OFI06773.1 cyclic di-GMP phosphodiesterase response regulator RpfG [Clostridium acetireducens DSM 10703]
MLKLHPKIKFEYLNFAVKEILGYNSKEIYDNPNIIFDKLYYKGKKFKKEDLFNNITPDYKNPVILTCISKNGNKVWLEFRNVPTYENNNLIFIEGIARDITRHILIEEKLKYISLHDGLTGLYNRNYFENLINNYDRNNTPNVGIIMCDIDGLKIINDTLGHSEGDKILIEAALVLKNACSNKYPVARIGGDEFAISIENCTDKKIENLNKNIQNSVDEYNSKNLDFHLSISTGFYFRKGFSKPMNEIFKKADNNMYSNKLNRKQSSRNSIIKTLMKTLEVRDFITEGHAERMKDLGFKFAVHLNLPTKTVNDICLLAQFHDIGKVGINDSILKKCGPLNDLEKNEMKRHCEIGYRISNSSKELMHISDLILKHHEWWNGYGYPLKIKEEDIPLECRIVSILDAYDAMISDRPYRKAMKKEEAIKELIKFKGIQFDPNLVEKFIEMVKKENI